MLMNKEIYKILGFIKSNSSNEVPSAKYFSHRLRSQLQPSDR